jgi:nucleoid-associated protein YgaU
MAALEYEVRDEYKDYSVAQLLDSPVTCFQGVGEIQSEILQRYFNVQTVKDLAHMEPFVQALHVQETVLEGGAVMEQSVADAAQQRELGFHIRQTDQARRILELPDASVHVLEGLTPAQDLALYDAFRITNLTQLAQNRIMLEARVIDYLAEHGSDGGEAGSSDALASILGARAATATTAQTRARSGDFEEGQRMQHLASQVTEHVRDRVAAMRDRAHDRAATSPAAGRSAATAAAGAGAIGAGISRMDAIRETRARGEAGGRQTDVSRGRTGASRTDQILASRGVGAPPRGSAGAGAGRGEPAGRAPAGAGGSRSDAVLAARQVSGRGGPPQASSGGATVRTRTPARPSGAGSATATATRAGAAAGAGAAALKTEEEAAAAAAGAAGAGGAAGAQAGPARRRQANPAPLIAAAILALIIVVALIWFLASRGGPEQTTTTAGAPGTEQTQAGAQPGTQPGTAGQPGAAGAPGTAATTTGPGTAPPPPAIKGTHTVARGDTLWFISQKEYADPLNWPSIFMENKDQIRNPDVIFPKQQFRIPAKPEYRFPDYPAGYRPSR